jgi:hypothetical protein
MQSRSRGCDNGFKHKIQKRQEPNDGLPDKIQSELLQKDLIEESTILVHGGFLNLTIVTYERSMT